MTEMSNFRRKQSQGLIASASHPYPNVPWGPPPSPPGQSNDSFHMELLKISEERSKEHRTRKPGILPPPPLSYISDSYLVTWEREKL